MQNGIVVAQTREKTVVMQTFLFVCLFAFFWGGGGVNKVHYGYVRLQMANRMITEFQGLLNKLLKSNKYKDSNWIKII